MILNRPLSSIFEKPLFLQSRYSLPEDTACYQLENGTFFLFKHEPPYALTAVIDICSDDIVHRKVEGALPPFIDRLICAGPYRDALYFYSTSSDTNTVTFYRATVNYDDEAVEFSCIREIQAAEVQFAHQQPFYVCDSPNNKVFGFEEDVSWVIQPLKENSVFFVHGKQLFVLVKGRIHTDEARLSFPVFGNAEIRLADPAKATIYARHDGGFLYIVAREELRVFLNKKLVIKFDMHRADCMGIVYNASRFNSVYRDCMEIEEYERKAHFGASARIAGVYGQVMVLCTSKAEGNTNEIWTAELHNRYYEEAAYQQFKQAEDSEVGYESDGEFEQHSDCQEMLSMLMTGAYRPCGPPRTTMTDIEKKMSKCKISRPALPAKKIIRKQAAAPAKRRNKKAKESEKQSEILQDDVASSGKLSPQIDDDEKIDEPGQKLPEKVDGSTEYSSKFSTEFTVKNILGVGGYGCVFKASNNYDDWDYAVKRVAVSPEAIDKALREVRAMARLDHPGIVGYKGTWIERPPEGWQFDADAKMLKQMGSKDRRIGVKFGDDDIFIYIQMQLCSYSLSDWLKNHETQSSRPLHRMKAWFKQIVSAVDYIHSNNIIHRDLKPSNILFAEAEVLKLCDLGIATVRRNGDDFETEFSKTEHVGTGLYMSPEQLAGPRYSSKADVFALGLILEELLVAMDHAKRYEIFNNIRRANHRSLAEDSRAKEFITKLTRFVPSERPSCKEMLDHIFLA